MSDKETSPGQDSNGVADQDAALGPESGEAADDVAGAGADAPTDADAGSDPYAAAPEPAPTSRPLGLTAFFALIFAGIATTVSGFLWWQYRQFYVSLNQTDTVLVGDMEGVRAGIRRLDDLVEALDGELEASRAQLAARLDRADARLEALPARFAALEQRVDVVQGGSFDARESLLRTEAEYYLSIANTELELAGHWENAIAALEIADARLRELANPALGSVRAAIADELIALNAVPLPDIEGIVFSLGRLSERIAELPLRAQGPTRFGPPEAALDEAEPGLGRLWLGVKSALTGIVSIERRAEPVATVLSAEEQLLARRQLQLELQLARISAIEAQQQTFEASLLAARALLEEDFDVGSGAVEGAMTLLDELGRFDIDPARPDISGSLIRLRSLSAGGD